VERSSLEERVARIEGILEQMDKRLSHVEKRPGSENLFLRVRLKV